MFDYLIGVIALIVCSSFLYLLGSSIRRNQDTFVINLIVGYISYSFCNAIVLIPIQILKLSWNLAFIYEILLMILSLLFIVYSYKKHSIKISLEKIKDIAKNNYFLVVITLLLFLIYLLQFDLIWINNHLDDGYYLTKIATLPYLDEPFSTSYATGLINQNLEFDTYLLSSYELENSIFLHILHIDPVIYCRVILNVFNYFLAASTVAALSQTLLLKFRNLTIYHMQYFSVILLLFAFEYLVLQKLGIFVVQDSWQFSSAMWYGSSISRMLGLMWIFILFSSISKITLSEIGEVFVLCVVLISKSASALPILFIGGVSLLTAYFFTNTKKTIWISCALMALLMILGVIIPGNLEINDSVNNIFLANKRSIVIYGSLLIMVVAFVKYRKYKSIARSILALIICFGLVVLPELNDSFELASQYYFVALRCISTILYTLVVLAYIFFLTLIKDSSSRIYKCVIGLSLGLFSIGAVVSTIPVYGNPLNTWKIMKDNPHIMPNSTVNLSKMLGQYKGDSLNVLSPEWQTIDNHRHSLSVMLRVYAPNIISVSAIPRFGVSEGNEFSTYGAIEQNIFNEFSVSPSEYTYSQLKVLLEQYPINCLVFPNDCFEEYVLDSGFELYTISDMYYIYLKV